MAGVFVKGTNGVWKRAVAGPSGVGSILYLKMPSGAWQVAAGGGVATSVWFRSGGAWVPEAPVTPP